MTGRGIGQAKSVAAGQLAQLLVVSRGVGPGRISVLPPLRKEVPRGLGQ